MDDKLKERVEKLIKEKISIVPYNPLWLQMFKEEAGYLRRKLPRDLIKRIEHFGSTAIEGLSAKPIIDILVEVTDLEETKKRIVPVLKAEGYEYLWRPAFGDYDPPYYAWFIKRNAEGKRTYHIHMVESDSVLWDRLYFRDYLKEFPKIARNYNDLKVNLSKEYPNDRVKYTEGKSEFIRRITEKAKEYYETKN